MHLADGDGHCQHLPTQTGEHRPYGAVKGLLLESSAQTNDAKCFRNTSVFAQKDHSTYKNDTNLLNSFEFSHVTLKNTLNCVIYF